MMQVKMKMNFKMIKRNYKKLEIGMISKMIILEEQEIEVATVKKTQIVAKLFTHTQSLAYFLPTYLFESRRQ
jgi:hypothetical protein